MSQQGIAIELTNRCNLNCLHCLRDKRNIGKDTNFPIKLVEKILKEIKFYQPNNVYISLTGGEPTIYPDFPGLAKLIIKNGYGYTMVTNGWDFIRVFNKVIKKYGCNHLPQSVCFSLDGACEKTHDAIRGAGSFRRVNEAINFFRKIKNSFNVQMIVHRLNVNEVDEVADFCEKIKVRSLAIGMSYPTPNLIEKKLVLSPKETFNLYKKVKKLKFLHKIGIFPSIDFYANHFWFRCRFLRLNVLNFNYKGELTFCCELSGYSSSDSKKDIIGSLKEYSYIDLKRKLIDKIGRYFKDRLKQIENKELDFLDRFPCFSCARYLDKVKWLGKYPQSEWYYERRAC